MPNYSKWLSRAESFARGIRNLPGRWSIGDEIAPPLTLSAADDLDRSLPHGLPSFLLDFYTTASADADCRYNWWPEGENKRLLGQIFRHIYGLHGGPRFCAATEIEEEQEGLLGWAETFDEFEGFGPVTAKTLRESVPLIHVGNGDYVVLHANAEPGQPKILYISHETEVESESPIIPLAQSGEQFMSDWEQLAYIGPEIWLLYPFLKDSATKLLDPNSLVARQWRSLLKELALPIQE